MPGWYHRQLLKCTEGIYFTLLFVKKVLSNDPIKNGENVNGATTLKNWENQKGTFFGMPDWFSRKTFVLYVTFRTHYIPKCRYMETILQFWKKA